MSKQPETFRMTLRRAEPFITRKDVMRISTLPGASLWEKFKLLFVKSHYSIDSPAKGSSDKTAVIRYKKMGDKIYVMKRGTTV